MVVTRSGEFSSAFAVDGQRVDAGPLAWSWRDAVGGMFTADAGPVGALLPSPQLHPLRVSRRRTVVTVGGAEVQWRLAGLPPFRSLDVQVIAMVTGGDRPAAPLLPMVGLMLDRGWASFGAGFVPLMVTTSNRVAAELYRVLLGWPAVVADVTKEHLPGHTRYVSSRDATVLVDVLARSGMPASSFTEAQPLYGVRDGRLFRATLSGRGSGGDTTGRDAAVVAVGEHPVVQGLGVIGLRERGWSSNHCVEFDQQVTGPVTVLGSATAPVETVLTSPAVAAALLSRQPTGPVALDQGMDALPFDPAGEFHTDSVIGAAA
jgi:hypothetical protein